MADIQWATVFVSAGSAVVVSIFTTWVNLKIKDRIIIKGNKTNAINLAKTLKEELRKNREIYNRSDKGNMSLAGFLEKDHSEITEEQKRNFASYYLNNKYHNFIDSDWKKINGNIATMDIDLFKDIEWIYERIAILKNTIGVEGTTYSNFIGQDIIFKDFNNKLNELLNVKLID